MGLLDSTPPTPIENTVDEITNLLNVGLSFRQTTAASLWAIVWGTVQSFPVSTTIDGVTTSALTPDPSQRLNVYGCSPQQVVAALGPLAGYLFQLGSLEASAFPVVSAIAALMLGVPTPSIPEAPPTGWAVIPALGSDGVTPTGAVTLAYTAP